MTVINTLFRLGPYVLKPVLRELRKHGERVDIEPRAYELLIFLVQSRARAVDKNELQDVIWPGMIVTETALTLAVMKARKAVGDDANRQEMIRTLHGHGYRFVADVTAGSIIGLTENFGWTGALAGGPPNVPSRDTRARVTFARGDAGKAAALMSRAKHLAGRAWSAENGAVLSEYIAGQQP